jgi:hypothetical protein
VHLLGECGGPGTVAPSHERHRRSRGHASRMEVQPPAPAAAMPCRAQFRTAEKLTRGASGQHCLCAHGERACTCGRAGQLAANQMHRKPPQLHVFGVCA